MTKERRVIRGRWGRWRRMEDGWWWWWCRADDRSEWVKAASPAMVTWLVAWEAVSGHVSHLFAILYFYFYILWYFLWLENAKLLCVGSRRCWWLCWLYWLIAVADTAPDECTLTKRWKWNPSSYLPCPPAIITVAYVQFYAVLVKPWKIFWNELSINLEYHVFPYGTFSSQANFATNIMHLELGIYAPRKKKPIIS